MPTVLYVQHAGVVGGSVVSLQQLVRDAAASGYRCVVLSPNAGIAAHYEEYAVESLVEKVVNLDHNSSYWYRLTPMDLLRVARLAWRSVPALLAYRRVLRRVNPDVVHLNSSVLPHYLVLTKMAGYPVVWHIRENVAHGYRGVRKALLRAVGNTFADKVVYISEKERGILGTRGHKSLVSYNYVDPERFRPVPGDKKEFLIVSLGGISGIKGTKTIVASARFLPEGFRILVVGSPDPRGKQTPTAYESEIVALLADPAVSAKVAFLPPTLDVPGVLRDASVLVFWGLVPHFPRPVYEAWLMALPVVVYQKVAACGDLDPSNAYLVDEDDPETLAAQLRAIHADPDGARRSAARGRETALRKFGPDNFLAVRRVYDELVQKSGRPFPPTLRERCRDLLVAAVPFPLVQRILPDKIILYGHLVCDDYHVAGTRYRYPSFAELEDAIAALRGAGYRFVGLPEFVELDGEKAVLLTFDDGFKVVGSCLHPFLKSRSIPYALFALAAPLDDPDWIQDAFRGRCAAGGLYLSADELRSLREDDAHIGYHTATHFRIGDETDPRDATVAAETALDERFRPLFSQPLAFAYPYEAPERFLPFDEDLHRLGYRYIFDTRGLEEKRGHHYFRVGLDAPVWSVQRNCILYNLRYHALKRAKDACRAGRSQAQDDLLAQREGICR